MDGEMDSGNREFGRESCSFEPIPGSGDCAEGSQQFQRSTCGVGRLRLGLRASVKTHFSGTNRYTSIANLLYYVS